MISSKFTRSIEARAIFVAKIVRYSGRLFSAQPMASADHLTNGSEGS
ncbi:MAG: hypothetical protein IPN51_02395 [Chloracidobacterium sp.]|nr:hypothetical protein [Chloracidobacterium sp.]